MSWKSHKLGDILVRKKVKANIQADQDYKLVTIRLWHQGVVLREKKRGEEIKSNMYLVNEGDFVLSGIDARNGAFGIVPEELEGAVVTNDFWCLEPKPQLLRKDFFLFLTSTKFFDYICNQCSDGTTQRIRLQKDKFYDFEIALPPIEEQEELVKTLAKSKKSNEDLSTELSHQLDLVKQLRQAFLREAMQGKLVPQDPSDEPASILLEKIKAEKERLVKEGKLKKQKRLPPITDDEIPFEIPEEWVWCRLGEMASLITSGSRNWNKYYSKTGSLFIRSQNIKPTSIDLTSRMFVDLPKSTEGKRTEVKTNDILITITGAGVSNSALLQKVEFDEGYVSQHISLVRLAVDQIAVWAHRAIVTDSIGKKQFDTMIYGDKPGLNLQQINSLIIPLPPLTEQQRIVGKLDELMQYCDKLEASIKESQQQNELLLQQVLREALEPKDAAEKKKLKEYKMPEEVRMAAEGD